MIEDKKIVIGLFGFGVVGEGIFDVLKKTPTLNATIKKICIKDPIKTRNASNSLFTKKAEELINDREINTIVELIDDSEAAYDIVKKSLLNKKSVVSANKKMIAKYLNELIQIQEENNVSLLYEAAVCGSVPVIRNLEEYYDNDLLHSFSGIVNGSTNFILTKMSKEGMSYSNALAMAQSLGFAESDPSLDVEGIDAANKLVIILKHAYGIRAKVSEILCKGITEIQESDTKYAKEKGYNIKLIASAKKIENDKILASVLPTFIEKDSQLFNIQNEFNGVLIGSKLADEQFLSGKGAGRYPTSSAVLSDISALRYNYKYEYKKSRNDTYHLSKNGIIRIYVSFNDKSEINIKDFITVEEFFSSLNRSYLIGSIDYEILKNSNWVNNRNNSIVSFNQNSGKENILKNLNQESINFSYAY